MPSIGTVTINDGLSTPVAHNFDPVVTNGADSKLADRSGGIPIGYPLILMSQKDPANGARNYRMQFNIVLPTVEADPVTGIDKVTRTARFNGEFVLPESSTLQERKNVLAFSKNLLADAITTAIVTNLEHVY